MSTRIEVPTHDFRPPPPGPARWAKTNLFSNWYNTLLTVALGLFFSWLGFKAVTAVLGGEYEIIRRNLRRFMIGDFARDALWRPVFSMLLTAVTIGLAGATSAASARGRAEEAGLPFERTTPVDLLQRFWPVLFLFAGVLVFTQTIMPTVLILVMLAVGLLTYFGTRRMPVSATRYGWIGVLVALVAALAVLLVGVDGGWNAWGGFQLNLMLTIFGIALAFPLGLLLALGRRSTLPLVRWISVTYIELIRGVPLITLLFMGIFALGFMLPEGLSPEAFVRVLTAIVLFEAAYIAEVVRGGLQSVPKGQVEAGQALGLPTWKTMRLIVLPQALRATIPAMVGQFISLFKDTTLVLIVGLLDLLRVAQTVNTQPDFVAQGLFVVTFTFAGLFFWVGSFTMSREARRLEKKLGVGER